MSKDFYISENSFRIWLPEVQFIEKSGDEDKFNSRQISGIMSTERKDRQGEVLKADGLDFKDFLTHGHFNDNHSQATSAIIGYPESVNHHNDLGHLDPKLSGVAGWTCTGYVLKGTSRSDGIWELAKSLMAVPNKKLGFSVEGKVERRADKTIEKARIRNVAITNCPVNTDCSWNVLEKSFHDGEFAKMMMAGGGSVLAPESLDSDTKKVQDVDKKKKARIEALHRALKVDDLLKAVDIVLEKRQDFDDDMAAYLVVKLLNRNGGI